MATPLSISIPLLGEKQTIEDYEPMFMAAVSTYLVTAEGKAVIIKTLPVYIARRDAKRAIALEATKKETLEEAFELLKVSLDPRSTSMRGHGSITTCIGLRAVRGRFFHPHEKEAKLSRHTARQACTNMISQLPEKVATSAKTWLEARDGEIPYEEARKFMVKIRTLLVEFPIDYGWRRGLSEKIQTMEDKYEGKRSSTGDVYAPSNRNESMSVIL